MKIHELPLSHRAAVLLILVRIFTCVSISLVGLVFSATLRKQQLINNVKNSKSRNQTTRQLTNVFLCFYLNLSEPIQLHTIVLVANQVKSSIIHCILHGKSVYDLANSHGLWLSKKYKIFMTLSVRTMRSLIVW